MAAKWRDIISGNDGLSGTVDVPAWTSRATLDIIGQGLEFLGVNLEMLKFDA